MCRLALAGAIVVSGGDAGACRLSLTGPPLQGRIAGATVSFDRAAFRTVTSPPGWTFQVDNDPSGRIRFHGHAIVGAAFLDRAEFEQLLAFSPLAGVACQATELRMSVTLDLYVGDRIKPVRLQPNQFDAVD